MNVSIEITRPKRINAPYFSQINVSFLILGSFKSRNDTFYLDDTGVVVTDLAFKDTDDLVVNPFSTGGDISFGMNLDQQEALNGFTSDANLEDGDFFSGGMQFF